MLARARDLTLALYREGAAHAEQCGIIVADKFEFGLLPEDRRSAADRLILIRRNVDARLLAVLAGG